MNFFVKKTTKSKFLMKCLFIISLYIIYAYVCNFTLLPKNIILTRGEELSIRTMFGVTIETPLDKFYVTKASSDLQSSYQNSSNISVNLFNKIPIKQIDVNIVEEKTVIPMGNAIGMKLYTKGVLVVGLTPINGIEAYKDSGIQEGDTLVQVNGEDIGSTEELMNVVNLAKGVTVELKYITKDGKEKIGSITPVMTQNNIYRIGLWVRDAAAGVGTLTFYEPETSYFGCLGHGITDIDTSDLINLDRGELVTTNILSIQKGLVGFPGQINGTIENSIFIGDIYLNSENGIYGVIDDLEYIKNKEELKVSSRNEVQTGLAYILCELENGEIKEYEIEIEKIYLSNYEDNKSMQIRIVDDELLEKTGGIVQGMSGAPIIQNNKFIGAVTYVLVNDPTTGYGVFADIMMNEIENIN